MEEDTKELDNLKEIIDNPTKPAIDIEDQVEEIKEIDKEMDSISETIKGIDKLSDEVKDVKEKPKKEKKKGKLRQKWEKLSKKEKVITISVIVVVLLLVIALVVILVVKNNKNKKNDKPKEKQVIIIKDNYRYENGTLVLLDDNDKDIGKYECKNKDEKLCYVAYLEEDKYLDVTRTIDEEGNPIDKRSPIIENRYVFIYDNEENAKTEKIHLYDIKKKKDLEDYSGVKLASKNNSIVKDLSGSYGVIKLDDGKVSEVIDFNYDNISSFNDEMHSYFMVNDGGRNFLLDSNKKPISKAISMNIANYNDNYIVGMSDGKKYYLYDFNNKMIFDEEYDYIKIYDEYVALVKDSKLFIRYYDGSKLHENGFDLTPKYDFYGEVNVVDKDNKVKETYNPFTIVKNTTTLTITIDKKDTVIDLKEGEISKATDYVNYFDGTLYFYSDKDKKNLMGSYTCTNKNVLSKDSTSFDNCFVASDYGKQDNDMTFNVSTGIIPIINSRYVFIKDNAGNVSDGNQTIVLYDLVDKKSLSKYANVNSNLNSQSQTVTFSDEVITNIIAQNKSGKYGILKVSNNGTIESLVPFDKYSLIEIIGQHYLAYDGSSYTLIDKNGDDLFKVRKVTSKIRGYKETDNGKYIKVSNGKIYHIFDYEGNKLTEKGFKYIELYDKYYVGISDDNKLNIYSYEKDIVEVPLLDESIKLNGTKYCGDGLLAFKVNILADQATIQILNSDEKYESTTKSLIKPVVQPENTEEGEEGEDPNGGEA